MLGRVVAVAWAAFLWAQAQEPFEHALWDSLLQLYTRNGRVHYTGIAREERFQRYLDSLAQAQPERWSREAQMSFWLNAYNACGVALVARRPGLRYIGQLDSLLQVDTFCIAGRPLTLAQIREQLRQFREPLLHFAAGGIAEGFPVLQRRAFTAGTLRRQLRECARRFLRSPRGCVLDLHTNTLWLSPLLQWFAEDFRAGGRQLLDWVAEYAEPTIAAYVAVHRQQLRVEFLAFDGQVNRLELPIVTSEPKPLKPPKRRKQ